MATKTLWGFWTVSYKSVDLADGWTSRTVNDDSLAAALAAISDYANENRLRVVSTSVLEERNDRVLDGRKYEVEGRTFELPTNSKGQAVSYVSGLKIAVLFETTEA